MELNTLYLSIITRQNPPWLAMLLLIIASFTFKKEKFMTVKKRVLIPLICITAIAAVALFNTYVTIHLGGHFEGFYLLKDTPSGKYEFTDHLFVGREKQIIYTLDLNNSYFRIARGLFHQHNENSNHLHCEWNPKDGNGMVSSYFADGTALVTYLGRYLDDAREVHGLFVGGGLPETVASNTNYNMNNSGMTYFDGKRWYHIWCSVNEGIGSELTGISITPAAWEFLGSRVERRSSDNVILTSSHKTVVNEIPVRIDRKMNFTAGQTYFNLAITITNIGTAPLEYSYLYGDEPWVGYYGTSLGDVGWVKDRIVSYEEMIDTTKYSFVGMADIGNRVIGEQPVYTNLANFIEWFGPERPTDAYFTNNLNQLPETGKVPLDSNERFVGVHWERILAPLESATIRLAIGMAVMNPQTGIPEKPATVWQ